MRHLILTVTYFTLLTGCGGGGTDDRQEPDTPPTNDPMAWEDVILALEQHDVADLALIVGDAEGELFRYEKGTFSANAIHPIASASKWLTSASILSLIEQGVMTLDDQPQDYLSYWTTDPTDPRSRITLAQLLSFTAGFHRMPAETGCIGDETYTLQNCVAELYLDGVDAEPGTTYFYGPVHMQVAAAMAEVATGQPWREIVHLTIATPLGLSSTGFAGDNPRASGAAASTAEEYSEFVRAHLSGQLLNTSFDELVTERVSNTQILSRPTAIDTNQVDWYYALGVWRECNQPIWTDACDAEIVISSAGAFGWYPWLDQDRGYYAVLAMNEPLTLLSNPAIGSLALGEILKPLIQAELGL